MTVQFPFYIYLLCTKGDESDILTLWKVQIDKEISKQKVKGKLFPTQFSQNRGKRWDSFTLYRKASRGRPTEAILRLVQNSTPYSLHCTQKIAMQCG